MSKKHGIKIRVRQPDHVIAMQVQHMINDSIQRYAAWLAERLPKGARAKIDDRTSNARGQISALVFELWGKFPARSLKETDSAATRAACADPIETIRYDDDETSVIPSQPVDEETRKKAKLVLGEWVIKIPDSDSEEED